ncbi:hypothetical protein MSG28_006482 [Choristoneura fumiferana]|uniref:Uncharacterized protein n=1 Tax=Choristoneura fumiferana TaxID=7141 RepID=A0ACC0JF94_CHOFU|nr:hypothetical protein MSG28_006482 [Choristoneura fumiferana]
MKKNKPAKTNGTKKSVKISDTESEKLEKSSKVDSLDDEDQNFGGWLKSSDGMETMKLFVLANSVVMLTTIAYPHIQTIFSIILAMIYGTDELH